MITPISHTLFEVDDHKVKIQTKKGRKIIICDCENDTRFCNESPICRHKQEVLHYLFTEKTRKEIQRLIKQYKGWCGFNFPIKPEIIYDDLFKLLQLIEWH